MITLQVVVSRLLWIDEPASCFFSFANFAAQVYYYHKYQSEVGTANISSKTYPYHYLWTIYSFIWAFAYANSTIFHVQTATYNNFVVQCMDYFPVILALSYMDYCAVIRIFEVTDFKRFLVAIPFVLAYVRYIYYMTCVLFDFGWHVNLSVILLVIHTLLWAPYCVLHRDRPYAKWFWLSSLSIALAAPLEIFDFPNRAALLGHFDAHSLWHAAGVVIGYSWCKFLIGDALWYSGKLEKRIR